jgi:Carboxypeptidase regulatory-like domain
MFSGSNPTRACLKCRRVFVVLLLLVFGGGSVAWAQTTGTISGYAKDQNGAFLPGVTVTAELEGQQLQRATVANMQGFFDFQALPRGMYVVTVELSGFQRQVRRVELTSGANVRLDVVLAVAGLIEQVTVTAEPTLVEARTATRSNFIDDQRVQDLPLSGRNVVGLAAMDAAVTNIRADQDMGDARNGSIISVNGGNQNTSNFTLNGSSFVHFNQLTGFNPPPPDAVQEIRIQTQNFSAEYGQTSGAQVTIVTRGGTNAFHGAAWVYNRNSALTSKSYFQIVNNTRKTKQNQNQAGWSAGGPFVRDKILWFATSEFLWNRREAGSTTTTVPTDLQRTGNFTALATPLRIPVNPLTGQAFTDSSGAPCIQGNIIRTSCISPVAATVLDRYVPQSDTGTTIFIQPAPRDDVKYTARVDYNATRQNRMTVNLFIDRNDQLASPGNVPYVGQQTFTNVTQGSVNDVHVLSRTLLNEATFSYLTAPSGGGAVTATAPRDLGVNVAPTTTGRGVSLSVTGGINLSYPGINQQGYHHWQAKDTMTSSRGNHTMKWGFDVMYVAFDFDLALTRSITFTGSRTGNALADFMIGASDTATMEFGIADHAPRGYTYQFFGQDSWKLHPRITLDYGLRYEPFTTWDQKGRRHTTFVPGVQSQVYPDAPAGILFPGDPGVPKTLTYPDLNNFAPRIGAAWDVAGDAQTVIRGGYGLFYQQLNSETTHAAEAPWRGSIQLLQGRVEDPFGSLGQTEPASGATPGRFGCAPIAQYPGLACSLFPLPFRMVYTDQHLRTPYQHHMSASLQRQITPNMAVEAAYVGRIGRKLIGHNFFNAAPFINSPRTGLPPSLQNIQERVPYSPGIISAASRVLGNFFRSEYHSLQLRLERRLANGFSVTGSYVYSKSLTDQPQGGTGLISSIPNPFDIASMWGPSLSDRRHVLATSWVWMPRVGFQNGVTRAILNDWTISGVYRMQSGTPLEFTAGQDVALNGATIGGSSQYAQLLPGVTAADVCRGSYSNTDDMLAMYFNPAGFMPVADEPRGIYGNARRGLCYGPGDSNIDLGITRTFNLGRGIRMQFRTEMFNAFNVVNFNNPTTNRSSTNFGRIMGSGGGRVVQIATKVLW